MVEKPITATQAFPLTCTAALLAIQNAAPSIHPNTLWNAYRVTYGGNERVVVESESSFGGTVSRATSVWTCVQTVDPAAANAAALTVSTTGLRADVAEGVNRAFFAQVK